MWSSDTWTCLDLITSLWLSKISQDRQAHCFSSRVCPWRFHLSNLLLGDIRSTEVTVSTLFSKHLLSGLQSQQTKTSHPCVHKTSPPFKNKQEWSKKTTVEIKPVTDKTSILYGENANPSQHLLLFTVTISFSDWIIHEISVWEIDTSPKHPKSVSFQSTFLVLATTYIHPHKIIYSVGNLT